MPPTFLSGAALAVLMLTACSPTYNWRELRPEGSALQALMPCKPESASRTVPLAGTPAALHMLSCDTGGLTFALAWAELPDAATAARALPGWRRASLAAIQSAAEPGDTPTRVPGAEQAWTLQAAGRDHRGQPVRMEAVHFQRGARVYQAAVYGRSPDAEVSATYFDGLRLP